MFTKIITITGKIKGQTSTILVGTHGNERCGVDALEKILPNLKIERGRVFLGFGNPKAIEKNVRYTEANLNRIFKENNLLSENDKKSYEYKRAQFLKDYLNQSDVLLDIHGSGTPISKPFIICEANAKKIIKYLPIDLVVSGFDSVEPGGTDYYMNSIGKIGICIECGFLENPESTHIAKESIFSFLKAQNHILNDTKPRKQSYIKMNHLYITKTNTFTLTKSFGDFEKISKEQLIGIDGDQEIKAEKDGVILFARNREKIGEEAFLFGEMKSALT